MFGLSPERLSSSIADKTKQMVSNRTQLDEDEVSAPMISIPRTYADNKFKLIDHVKMKNVKVN